MFAFALDAVISLLILQLGDSRYSAREKAHRALAVLAPLSVSQLERAKSHPDMEVRRRAFQLYKPFHVKKVEALAFALREPMPWLCIACHYEQSYYVTEAGVKHGARSGGPDWTDYRVGCKLWCRDRLLAGASVSEVQSQLEWMAGQEREWVARYVQR